MFIARCTFTTEGEKFYKDHMDSKSGLLYSYDITNFLKTQYDWHTLEELNNIYKGQLALVTKLGKVKGVVNVVRIIEITIVKEDVYTSTEYAEVIGCVCDEWYWQREMRENKKKQIEELIEQKVKEVRKKQCFSGLRGMSPELDRLIEQYEKLS